MSTWNLSDDDVLLALLGRVIDEADPVPEAAVLAAKVAAGIETMDAELAGLVADSLLDEGVLTRRDLSTERLVSFASSRLNVDIELPAAEGTLFGAVSPPEPVEVEVETPTGRQTTSGDSLGRFHVEVGGGRCRLRIVTGEGTVVTPWIIR